MSMGVALEFTGFMEIGARAADVADALGAAISRILRAAGVGTTSSVAELLGPGAGTSPFAEVILAKRKKDLEEDEELDDEEEEEEDEGDDEDDDDDDEFEDDDDIFYDDDEDE